MGTNFHESTDSKETRYNTTAGRASQISNHVLLEESAKRVVNLESQKKALQEEVLQVERELLNAKALHGKLLNQVAPVAMLPNEVLSDIFQLCLGSPVLLTRTSYRRSEIVASHVSTHWRSIALGTPLLWNTINLRITSRTMTLALHRLSEQLERSAQCLLDISLHLQDINTRELLQYITPHAHRWRHVSISIRRCSTEDIYAPFRLLATPNLTHLSLRVGVSDDDTDAPRTEYPDTCPLILTKGSPSLTFVRVAGKVVGNLSPALNTIRTLHVDAWPRNLMSLAQFQTLLGTLPCLVHLSLTGLSIHLPRDPLQTAEPIPLPMLRSLRIRGNSTPCHRLLSLLALPHLESLLLQGVETFDSPVTPSLCSLTLYSCSLSMTGLQNIFRAFPRVVTLEVDDSTPEIYPMLTPAAGSHNTVPWPELRSISLKGLPRRDVVPISQLCLSRLDRGWPLRCLYLDRRSRTVLRSKELFEGLGELQPIENADDLPPWPADLGYEDPDDAWY